MSAPEKRLPTEPPESYPLPWYAAAEECDESPGNDYWGLWSRNEKEPGRKGDRWVGDCPQPTDEALADYIVTAANGYPVLLAALEIIANGTGVPDDVLETGMLFAWAQRQARAALNKIEVGS